MGVIQSWFMHTSKVLGFTALVKREGKLYSSWAPEIEVASYGKTVKDALAHLQEAIELHLECLSLLERKKLLAEKVKMQVATLRIGIPA